MRVFDKNNKDLRDQFENITWIEESGIDPDALQVLCKELTDRLQDQPIKLVKAKTFALILEKSRIAVNKSDIFQDKIQEGTRSGKRIMPGQRWVWENHIKNEFLKDEVQKITAAGDTGSYRAASDFGHTSPNSRLLLEIGFPGLLENINNHAAMKGLSQEQRDFYESCQIILEAIISFIRKLAYYTAPYNKECSTALFNLSNGRPSNIYEAMQLIVLYFFLHENVAGTRVRTLGRLDVMLYPFYVKDLEDGTYTEAEIKEMIKFFFYKLWTAKIPYDLPLCLGGMDENGVEVTNKLTYLLVETYNEMDIHSPKIHIRVSHKTPADFVKLVLRCIRGGNSSFVFVNDNTVIKSLMNVGISEKDAMNYVPIGCYEPAVWGKEIGSTGNGGVNAAKAIEFAITNGVDLKTGKQVSIRTDTIVTYDDFLNAVKAHIRFMTESGMDYIRKIEKYYGEIGPDPLLSCMYEHSVETGVDVYEGGAQYNNSSFYIYCIATLIDSVCAVKRLVFEDKKVTFKELCDILKSNWDGKEKLRLLAKNIPEKYGNNNPVADSIMRELTDYFASLVNNVPNGRGGVFKAANFCIDRFVYYGEKTMATPDGRFAGEVLSKNLCATVGMDKNGITSLIHSATKIDHSKFPNGTVLDIILHPTAVSGEDGLNAFYSLLKTYLAKGGLAFHGNVFCAEELKNAQKDPGKYKTLQVRVCGWNAYFINLSKSEQDCFIKQAETTYL